MIYLVAINNEISNKVGYGWSNNPTDSYITTKMYDSNIQNINNDLVQEILVDLCVDKISSHTMIEKSIIAITKIDETGKNNV